METSASGWIVVTGAAGHLGRQICHDILKSGGKVVGIDTVEQPDELAPWTSSIVWVKGDLLQEDFLAQVVRVCAGLRGLIGLVNNAAFVGTDALGKWTEDARFDGDGAWSSTINLNLSVPFKLSRDLSPHFEEGASIVNIASIYGVVAPSWHIYPDEAMSNPAAYGASKAGLIQLTKWLSSVLAPTIRVNAVSPGGIERSGQHVDFVANYKGMTHLGAMAHEKEVSPSVLFLLSPASSHITGHNLVVDGGFTSS